MCTQQCAHWWPSTVSTMPHAGTVLIKLGSRLVTKPVLKVIPQVSIYLTVHCERIRLIKKIISTSSDLYHTLWIKRVLSEICPLTISCLQIRWSRFGSVRVRLQYLTCQTYSKRQLTGSDDDDKRCDNNQFKGLVCQQRLIDSALHLQHG